MTFRVREPLRKFDRVPISTLCRVYSCAALLLLSLRWSLVLSFGSTAPIIEGNCLRSTWGLRRETHTGQAGALCAKGGGQNPALCPLTELRSEGGSGEETPRRSIKSSISPLNIKRKEEGMNEERMKRRRLRQFFNAIPN